MAINNIDRGGLHWKGKLAPHMWFANFYSNPFILFVGYYSFLHQGPGGGERWENVGPFSLPKAPLCFSRFFVGLLVEGYATKPILVVFRVWLPCGRTQKFIVQVVSGWIFNISKMAGGNNQKRAGSVVYPEEPIQPTDCWVGSDKFCSPLIARKSKI